MKLKWLEGLGRELRDLILQILRDYSEALLLAVLMAVVLRVFVVGSYKVSNTTMEPSLHLGDFVLGYKLPFGFEVPFTDTKIGRSLPKRGQVVVFQCPNDESRMCVKRVVGLPGDRIEIKGKRLIVNGKMSRYEKTAKDKPSEFLRGQASLLPLNEITFFGTYPILISGSRENENFGPYIVPRGAAFVLADNRDFGEDSRHWGGISLAHIESRLQFIWFSVEWKRVAGGSFDADVRWDRILEPVH